jgi:hypothetical protein
MLNPICSDVEIDDENVEYYKKILNVESSLSKC